MSPSALQPGTFPNALLKGQRIALTGRFALGTHREIAQWVRKMGGHVVADPSSRTGLLIVGQNTLPQRQKKQSSRKMLRARRLQAAGAALEILTEEAFWDRVVSADNLSPTRQRYTAHQIQRIVGVDGSALRVWLRAGLLDPAPTDAPHPTFDFQQVARARCIAKLVRLGVSVSRLRRCLQRLGRFLPPEEHPLARLVWQENPRRLCVRLASGKRVEPQGQYQLEFPVAEGATHVQGNFKTVDQCCDEAIEHELRGQMTSAAAAYRAALELTPADPVLHFNLANVLYAAQDRQAAATHWRWATHYDAAYAEAWNNLGNVLSELGEATDAIRALRRALQLEPEYADAHDNLAHVLHACGERRAAAAHWRRSRQLRRALTSPNKRNCPDELKPVR